MRETASCDVLRVKIGSGAWAVGRSKNPDEKRVNILMRNFARTGKRNLLMDRDQIMHIGRYPGITYAAFVMIG